MTDDSEGDPLTDIRRVRNIDKRAFKFTGNITVNPGASVLVDFDNAAIRKDLRKYDARWVEVPLGATVTVGGTEDDVTRTCRVRMNHPGVRALHFYIADDVDGTPDYGLSVMKSMEMNGSGSPLNQHSSYLTDQDGPTYCVQTDDTGAVDIDLLGYTDDGVWGIQGGASSGYLTISDGTDTSGHITTTMLDEENHAAILSALQSINSIAGHVTVVSDSSPNELHIDTDAVGFIALTLDDSNIVGGSVSLTENQGPGYGTTPYLVVLLPNGLITSITAVPLNGGDGS